MSGKESDLNVFLHFEKFLVMRMNWCGSVDDCVETVVLVGGIIDGSD